MFRGQVHYDLSKFFTLSQEPIRFFVTKLESALNVESSQLKSQVRFFCCFSRFSKQSAFFWQIRLSQVIFLKNATRSDKSLIFFSHFFLKHTYIQTNFQFMFNIFFKYIMDEILPQLSKIKNKNARNMLVLSEFKRRGNLLSKP